MSHRSSRLSLYDIQRGTHRLTHLYPSSLLLSFLLIAVHKPKARAGIYFITFTCYKRVLSACCGVGGKEAGGTESMSPAREPGEARYCRGDSSEKE